MLAWHGFVLFTNQHQEELLEYSRCWINIYWLSNAQLQWVTDAEKREAFRDTKKNSKILFIFQFPHFNKVR